MNKLSQKNNKIHPKIFLHLTEPSIKVEGFEFFDVSKINKIKAMSLEEVIIQDLLEYFSDSEAVQLLVNIASKLKSKGKLHLQGTDANSLCCGVAYSQLDIMTFKTLLFGAKKNNIFNVTQIKKSIENYIKDVEINKIKFLNGLQYYIECVKK